MKLAVMALAWVGTWATAPQPFMPGSLETYENETLRLIVHVSEGGPQVRIHLSNLYGDQPLAIGAAHIARRAKGAETLPGSDRRLLFQGQPTALIPAHGSLISDPVDLEVPVLSDLAVSLYLPKRTEATGSGFSLRPFRRLKIRGIRTKRRWWSIRLKKRWFARRSMTGSAALTSSML